MEVRRNITRTVTRRLPQLTVTERAEDAEVSLVFNADVNSYMRTATSTTASGVTTTTPQYGTVINGQGFVARRTPDGHTRIIMDFRDSSATIFERRPSTNFARAFIREYQRVNSLSTRPHRGVK